MFLQVFVLFKVVLCSVRGSRDSCWEDCVQDGWHVKPYITEFSSRPVWHDRPQRVNIEMRTVVGWEIWCLFTGVFWVSWWDVSRCSLELMTFSRSWLSASCADLRRRSSGQASSICHASTRSKLARSISAVSAVNSASKSTVLVLFGHWYCTLQM